MLEMEAHRQPSIGDASIEDCKNRDLSQAGERIKFFVEGFEAGSYIQQIG